jgi:GrpB-like predicted nucleotidyltransferase (UPF0157 family)
LKFAKEKANIMSVIGHRIVAIEHIGSTAVQGLCAKPIIDIMVGNRRLVEAKHCIVPLESIDYEYVPEYEASLPERRYFRKGPSEMPNKHFHLHMAEHNSDFWKRHLQFRDYLRTHHDTAQQYCELKKKLAAKHRWNREAYTEAKTEFIESVVRKAAEESFQSRENEELKGFLAGKRSKHPYPLGILSFPTLYDLQQRCCSREPPSITDH